MDEETVLVAMVRDASPRDAVVIELDGAERFVLGELVAVGDLDRTPAVAAF
jgi:hypothetical protein